MAKPGTFKAGQSGNPGGRPKAIVEVIDLARKETAASIKTLAAIRDELTAPHAARVASATALLDRAWGKPTTMLGTEDEKGLKLFIHTGIIRPDDERSD
jgi:hypothetical protein